jgi:hypothetical protein
MRKRPFDFYIYLIIESSLKWPDNNKKIIIKIQKKPLDASLIFFFCFQWHFSCFNMLLKLEKIYLFSINLIMTNGLYENTSMPSIVSFKFFGGKNKIV